MNAFIEVNEESCGRENVKMNAMSVMEWQLCYLGKVRKLFYLCANDLFLLLLLSENLEIILCFIAVEIIFDGFILHFKTKFEIS